MRVLLVKTSSMGDLIHTWPALTDAAAAVPGLRLDWVVEQAFAGLAGWHPAVARVIPVALRRWRHSPWRRETRAAWRAFRRALGAERYDAVIDAQGLYKSAVLATRAEGPRHGYDFASGREPLAALTYHHRHAVPRSAHAIDRVRRLFAAALGYPLPGSAPEYGIDRSRFGPPPLAGRYIVFLHGAAWRTKLWPVERWQGLADRAGAAGLGVCLPWYGEEDRCRAEAIAEGRPHAVPLALDQAGVAAALAGAAGAVAVETGFGHLAAALGVPQIALFGPTGIQRHGMIGAHQGHRVAGLPCSPCHKRTCRLNPDAGAAPPCMAALTDAEVWAALSGLGGFPTLPCAPLPRPEN